MEEENIPQQFRKLEEKVGQLLQTCLELQNSRAELEARVRDLEDALRIKDAAEHQYMEEKNVVRSKIDDLLTRLDRALEAS